MMDEDAFLRHKFVISPGCGDDSKRVRVESMSCLVTVITYGGVKERIDGMTMPVTVAAGERNFPGLQFIKNDVRSTVLEDSLNNLAILTI